MRFIGLHHQQPETYSEPFTTSKLAVSAKIVSAGKPLTIFVKGLNLDVRLGCECTCDSPSEYYSMKASLNEGKKTEPSISSKLLKTC